MVIWPGCKRPFQRAGVLRPVIVCLGIVLCLEIVSVAWWVIYCHWGVGRLWRTSLWGSKLRLLGRFGVRLRGPALFSFHFKYEIYFKFPIELLVERLGNKVNIKRKIK